MRSITQQGATQFQDFPSIPDQLEAMISDIECRLLDSLTPNQFKLVQHLVEAQVLLTELSTTVSRDMYVERKSA